MAQRTTLSFEIVLHFLILLLAFTLRFADLGVAPLTEFEAKSALSAHSLANGGTLNLGDQPAYVLLTSWLFSLLGSSEFVARLTPALFGLALVALPYSWRDVLGQKVALMLTFALTLDPGMVAVSRLASGHMIAVAAAVITLTAWRYSRPVAAGIFAAIALLASSIIFYGVISAVLVWLSLKPRETNISDQWRLFFLTIVITLFLGGTWFLTTPGGLAGLGSTVTAFVTSFTQPGVPVSEIGLALLGYSLPAILIGVVGAASAWQNNNSLGKVASLFAFFALLLVVLNPGREVADLLWVVLALWVLSAIQVGRYISWPQKEIPVALGEFGLMLLLGIFFGLALSKLAAGYSDFIYVGFATFGLAVLATLLIAFGWSRNGAEHGFIWALLLFSALFLLSASTRFLRVETTDANDLWDPGPAAGSSRTLSESLHDISVLDTGQLNELAMDLRSENPSIAWELRNLSVADATSPPLILTPQVEAQTEQFAAYRGQSFAVNVQRAWTGWPDNFFAWLFYRQALTQTEEVVLWARADLFPDVQSVSGTAPNP